MTKLLFFQWNSFLNEAIEKGLCKLNIEYDTFLYQFIDWEEDDDFLEKLDAKLKTGAYHKVFSVNFAPLVSEICQKYHIPYISWVYDSPVHIHDLDTMKRNCNTIYFFDRGQVDVYKKMGIPAKHMPLAVDCEVFGKRIKDNQLSDYETDISLVGKLYQSEYDYMISPLNDYEKGYLEGIIKSQGKIYGGYLIPELVTDDLLIMLNETYEKASGGTFSMGRRELEFLLATETTGRERKSALNALAEHFHTSLYSNEKDDTMKRVHQMGYADYYTVMPNVFHYSKINLNIVLKTIRTGIPLRVLDILGCGGFVLSSYGEELAEYFQIGEECEIYENEEDMIQKAGFYIEHDTERRCMIQKGMERIRRDFTIEDRLLKMLN